MLQQWFVTAAVDLDGVVGHPTQGHIHGTKPAAADDEDMAHPPIHALAVDTDLRSLPAAAAQGNVLPPDDQRIRQRVCSVLDPDGDPAFLIGPIHRREQLAQGGYVNHRPIQIRSGSDAARFNRRIRCHRIWFTGTGLSGTTGHPEQYHGQIKWHG